MKVVLFDSVEGLGNSGDVVDVADGYARNALIPRRLAAKATAGVVAQAEKMREAWTQKNAEDKSAAEGIATKLAGSTVEVQARASKEGKLFGSVGAKDIADALMLSSGVEFDRKMILLKDSIQNLGEYQVNIRPHAEVEFAVTVDVTES